MLIIHTIFFTLPFTHTEVLHIYGANITSKAMSGVTFQLSYSKSCIQTQQTHYQLSTVEKHPFWCFSPWDIPEVLLRIKKIWKLNISKEILKFKITFLPDYCTIPLILTRQCQKKINSWKQFSEKSNNDLIQNDYKWVWILWFLSLSEIIHANTPITHYGLSVQLQYGGGSINWFPEIPRIQSGWEPAQAESWSPATPTGWEDAVGSGCFF